MNKQRQYILILLLNFIYAHPLSAKLVEEAELNFPVKAEAVLKGDIHYSFTVLSPKKLLKIFPEAKELDSQSVLKQPKVKVVLAKSVYLINQPVGFFDHEHVNSLEYMDHVMGEQDVKRLGPNAFEISVPGEAAHSYKVKTYFDSDDISTLPNSKVIRGTAAAKKLDVISQSASSIVFREHSEYSKYAVGGSVVSSYVPLKDGKTLVISYHLLAVKKPFALDKALESNFRREVEAIRELTNSFSGTP